MAEAITVEKLYDELKKVNKRLDILEKENEIEVMTSEQEKLHEQGLKEYREGKSISFDELKKEMEIVHGKIH